MSNPRYLFSSSLNKLELSNNEIIVGVSGTDIANFSNTELGVSGPINLTTGNDYQINSTSVLSNDTLGSGVVNSSLTSVGNLTDLTVVGDLTVDTNTLYVDSSNNRVGLGTATPDVNYIADIRGNVKIEDTTPDLDINNLSSSAPSNINFQYNDTTQWIMYHTGITQTSSWIDNNLFIQNDTTNTNLITLTTDDKVGIRTNTTEPNSDITLNGETEVIGNLIVDTNTLYVDSSNDVVGIRTATPITQSGVVVHLNNTGTETYSKYTTANSGATSTDGLEIGLNSSNQAVIRNRKNNSILFYTNNALNLTLSSSGVLDVPNGSLFVSGGDNVGIGRNSADYLLDVYNTTNPVIGLSNDNGASTFSLNASNDDLEINQIED
jgi:hypothetical protein